MLGYGGCPMAEHELVGNIATETIIERLDKKGSGTNLDLEAFAEARRMAFEIFGG